jgi:hypothetical protein
MSVWLRCFCLLGVVALAELAGAGCDSTTNSAPEVKAGPETAAPTAVQSAKPTQKQRQQPRTLRKMN